MYKIFQHRNKCNGCHACVEAAPQQWAMSNVDGKAILIGAISKKGIHTLDIQDWELEANTKAKVNCSARVIDIIKI